MKFDPIELEVFKNLFQSIAEEMGAALMRTSFSPNIKERCDFSCALFDGHGKMIIQGKHLPVHLGSMPLSVLAIIKSLKLNKDDAGILNDPYNGGTHLPDITIVSPVFTGKSNTPRFYTANRAHHSDIGGMTPGSMPLSSEIYQEGLIIPPTKIVEAGIIKKSILNIIRANVRTPDEREGDLKAQLISNKVGEKRIIEIVEEYGLKKVNQYIDEFQKYSERIMRKVILDIPDGEYNAVDYLDNDGFSDKPIKINVTLKIRGSNVVVDFTGTDKQTRGSVNCVFPVTLSAVCYVFRSIVEYPIPSNDGYMIPIKVTAQEGSLVNAMHPSPVVGGNVETSQRIVDVVLKALSKAIPDKIPAASSGTMNNLSIGGISKTGKSFSYYETIGGGAGANNGIEGESGVHTHMTNTLNTPIEVIENVLPVKILCYKLRKKSAGKGKYKGGEGITREVQFLTDAVVSVLSERRNIPPYGIAGGEPGKCGSNILKSEGKNNRLDSKFTLNVKKGDVLKINTPGGGGWGKSR
ncbi:hydantoinase B/oxoprolinase family protein [candidate division KSB1 bacterium]